MTKSLILECMCRLFGFRSVITSQVHSSLVSADNALLNQSNNNPDGWGVSYYLHGVPHLIKSTNSALNCSLFQKVSGVVKSHTVLAHIRKATEGSKTSTNTHPFQYGRWTFAHNGNIKDFTKHQEDLLALIDDELKGYVLGDTDSEVIFFILLSEIKKKGYLDDKFDHTGFNDCLRQATKRITDIIGELNISFEGKPTENYITFILTNGKQMFGLQGGQPLHYTSHKTSCSEKDSCDFYNDTCLNIATDSPVNHLIISSEPLQGENIWTELSPGELVFVDNEMKVKKESFSLPFTKS
jgi:predicted glutamine amidotransferase